MFSAHKIFPLALVLALSHGAPSLAEPVPAGIAAAVRGDVTVLSSVAGAAHLVKSGEQIFLGDAINSVGDAGLQLMLPDETVFTVGADTNFTIDEFAYDPATGTGSVTTSLARGVVRFVTGNISEGGPGNMVINLPDGSIGIRGTIGVAVMDGEGTLVVLLSLGDAGNAGRLEVTSGGRTINLTRPQFGTRTAPGQPPSQPFQLSATEIVSVMSAIDIPPTLPASNGSEPQPQVGGEVALIAQDIADGELFAGDTRSLDQFAVSTFEVDTAFDELLFIGVDIALDDIGDDIGSDPVVDPVFDPVFDPVVDPVVDIEVPTEVLAASNLALVDGNLCLVCLVGSDVAKSHVGGVIAPAGRANMRGNAATE